MISLFVKSGSSAENMLFLSNNKRAFIHCEEPNYREIIEAEVSGQYITGLSNSEEARGESRRLKEYNEKVQALPEAYQILSDQLPLIGETVGNIRQECEKRNINITESALRNLVIVIKGCERQIQLLQDIMDQIIDTPGDSVWTRQLKAIRSLRFQSDADHLYTKICDYRDTLSSYHASLESTQVAIDPDKPPIIVFPDNRRSRFFIGREDILSDIEYSFDNCGECKPPIVILRAMGGQGKTQIALRFCQRAYSPVGHKNRRYYAIFWVDASTEGTTRKCFKNIRTAIERNHQTYLDEDDEIAYVKSTIKTWSFPWLMVFDNYDNPSDFPNIEDFIPFGIQGAILITTRHEDVRQLGTMISVPGLPEDDAVTLLMNHCEEERKPNNLQVAQEIVEILGYHPLAIHQAGGYIFKNPPIQSFLDSYETEKRELMEWTPTFWDYKKIVNEEEQECVLSVFTTWELSIKKIANEDTRRKIERFLAVCAYLGKTTISESLIKASSASETNQWMDLFLRDGQWSSRSYSNVLIELRALALVQPIAGEPKSFLLHPLVSDWLKCRGEESTLVEKQQLDRASAAALLKTYLRFIFNDSAHGYLDTSAAIRESILLQVTSCEGNIEKFLHLSINSDDWENISETFAEFHESVGDYSNALALQSEVVRRRKIKLSPDNPDLISSQCLLGQIYNSLGQFEEAEYQLSKVQLQKRASSKQDISVLKAADNLIWALVCQGKYAEAKVNLEQQTRALRSLYGEDSRPLLRNFRMLGWALANDDNLGDAESLIANTTAKCEEFFGENDLDTLTCYNAQGVLYRMEGVVSKAEELIRKAAEGRTNRLGRAHPSTLNALTNLSMVLASQANKFDEGETLAREVLSLRQKKLGEYHTSTLVSVVNLMRILLEGRDTYGRAYGSEIKELQFQAKLGEALDKGVWGADILDSQLGTTRLDGDLGVLLVFRTSRFGPKEWIRSHIPDWSKRHKQPTHSRLPTTYERVDLRTYLSALQQTQ